jgi:hypothetical protein
MSMPPEGAWPWVRLRITIAEPATGYACFEARKGINSSRPYRPWPFLQRSS